MATDQQDTCPADLSPVVKEWQDQPPTEIAPDTAEPVRFADMVKRPLEPTVVLGDSASSEALIPEHLEQLAGQSENVETENKIGETVNEKGDEAVVEKGQETAPENGGVTDLFHNQDLVTRADQYEQRDALQNEKKKKGNEKDPEESIQKGNVKNDKKAAAREKQKAKAKAKIEKNKEKAQKKKEAAKQKKEAAKEKKAAAKAKAKAKAAAKKLAKAGKTKAAKPLTTSKSKANKKPKTVEAEAEGEESPSPVAVPEPMAVDVPEPVDVPQPVPEPDNGAADNASVEAAVGEAEEGSGKKTFARRNRPKNTVPAARFDAIRDIWNKHLEGRLNNSSAMEAGSWHQTLKKVMHQFHPVPRNPNHGMMYFFILCNFVTCDLCISCIKIVLVLQPHFCSGWILEPLRGKTEGFREHRSCDQLPPFLRRMCRCVFGVGQGSKQLVPYCMFCLFVTVSSFWCFHLQLKQFQQLCESHAMLNFGFLSAQVRWNDLAPMKRGSFKGSDCLVNTWATWSAASVPQLKFMCVSATFLQTGINIFNDFKCMVVLKKNTVAYLWGPMCLQAQNPITHLGSDPSR